MAYVVIAVGNFDGDGNPPKSVVIALYDSIVDAFAKRNELRRNPDPRATYGVHEIAMNSSQI